MTVKTNEIRTRLKGHAVTDYTILLAVVLLMLIGAAHVAGEKVHGLLSDVVNSFQPQRHGDSD